MEKTIKQTPITLYVMVMNTVRHSMQLLNANKIKELVPFLPSKEALETHFEMERFKISESRKNGDNSYRPQPLYIGVESSIFVNIIKAIRSRNSSFIPEDHVPLTLGQGVPCCILMKVNQNNK